MCASSIFLFLKVEVFLTKKVSSYTAFQVAALKDSVQDMSLTRC